MKESNDDLSENLSVKNTVDFPSTEETASSPYPVGPFINRPKLDRVLVFMSLVVMACTSFMASVVVLEQRKKDAAELDQGEIEKASKVEEQKWYADWPTDIQNLSEKSVELVSDEHSVAIFENGTCVVVNEPVENSEEVALNVLLIAADPNADFEIEHLPNSNYKVVFSPSVFAWIEAKHVASYKNTILEKAIEGLSEKEVNELNGRKLPLEARIGILARSRLLEDSNVSNVVEVVRMKPTKSKGRITQMPMTYSTE